MGRHCGGSTELWSRGFRNWPALTFWILIARAFIVTSSIKDKEKDAKDAWKKLNEPEESEDEGDADDDDDEDDVDDDGSEDEL